MPVNQSVIQFLENFIEIKAVCWLDVEFERVKFYPGPGVEPGPLAFRANVLTK